MAPGVKTVNFVSNNLGINANLLLVFDDDSKAGLYKDYYPSAFAVRKFGAKNIYRSPIIYRTQLAFTKVVISDDIIQSASTEVPINVGQSTILSLEDEIYSFSDPKTDGLVPRNNIRCTNNVPFKEDIGVGFIEEEGDVPRTALVWRDVAHGRKLDAEFIPHLRGYIDINPYKENGVIKAPIGTDRLFDQNLNTLHKESTWVITYDASNGVFSIDEEMREEAQ